MKEYVSGFPKSIKGHEAIWKIIVRLTKLATFLLAWTRFSMDQLLQMYINEVVQFHGVPVSIVSNKDPVFISNF